MVGILDFFFPHFGGMRQQEQFDEAARRMADQIQGGSGVDKNGMPFLPGATPPLIEPDQYNKNQLPFIQEYLRSGSPEMQKAGLELAQGLVTDQSTRKRLSDIMAKGGNLKGSLELLASDPDRYKEGYANLTKLATDNPPTIPGLPGEFSAAKQIGQTLPNETMEQYAERIEKAKSSGRSKGDPSANAKERAIDRLVKVLGWSEKAAIEHVEKVDGITDTFLGETVGYKKLPNGKVQPMWKLGTDNQIIDLSGAEPVNESQVKSGGLWDSMSGLFRDSLKGLFKKPDKDPLEFFK